MSATLSLAQSSFLLSSLVAPTPHRDDGRSLDAYRPIELHPPIEAGYAHIQLGSTSVTAHASCQAVRSTTSIDQSSEDDNDDGANDDEGSGEGAGLWNVNISTASNVVPPVSNGGNSSKTGCVELDAQLDHLTHLIKRHLTSVVPVEQFLILKNSSHAMATTHAEKLRGATYWAVHVDITIESMAGGNLYDTIWASTVASLYRLRIPRTREIAYIPPGATEDVAAVEELGIKSLKGQGKQKQQQQTQGKAIDFELVDGNEEGGELVKGRELLGAGITVGLLPNYTHILDPTLEEELSLPSSRRLFIVASRPQQSASIQIHTTHLLPSLLGLTAGEGTVQTHVVDSATGLSIPSDEAIRFPQSSDPNSQWEDNGSGWGIPLYPRVRMAVEYGGKLAVDLGSVLRVKLDAEEEAQE